MGVSALDSAPAELVNIGTLSMPDGAARVPCMTHNDVKPPAATTYLRRLSLLAAACVLGVAGLTAPPAAAHTNLPAPTLSRNSEYCTVNSSGQFTARANFSGKLIKMQYRDWDGKWKTFSYASNPTTGSLLRGYASTVPTVETLPRISVLEQATDGHWSPAAMCLYRWK
jgi:hypothetical protein